MKESPKNNKKKVLMCYHSADYGGVEQQIADIINGLSGDIDFYIACPNGPLVKKYFEAGAVGHINIKPKSEADFIYSLNIARLIKKKKIDIVHSHELLTGFLAMLGAWIAGCERRIYHVHTSFTEWKHKGIKKYPALFVNTLANYIAGNFFATDVLALTGEIKRVRMKKEFIKESKITVIPNGVDLKRFKFSEIDRDFIRDRYNISSNDIVIGNMARFTEEKGQAVLLEAFKDLTKSDSLPNKNLKLLFAGGGKLLQKVKNGIVGTGLENEIIFTDKFKEEDKVKLLCAIDTFVFPSFAEGFGIALIEAMSTGLPVIASDLPVLKDVGGDAAIYFKTGDHTDLARVLKDQLKPDLRRIPVVKSTDRAKLYSMDNFWYGYRNLYLK